MTDTREGEIMRGESCKLMYVLTLVKRYNQKPIFKFSQWDDGRVEWLIYEKGYELNVSGDEDFMKGLHEKLWKTVPLLVLRAKIAYQLVKEALIHPNVTSIISSTIGEIIERKKES